MMTVSAAAARPSSQRDGRVKTSKRPKIRLDEPLLTNSLSDLRSSAVELSQE
jgi:hypothetical protein